MLIPAKHEILHKNLLVIGASIIAALKKKHFNMEKLYMQLKEENNLELDQYYNAVTFLWLTEVIEVKDYILKLKK